MQLDERLLNLANPGLYELPAGSANGGRSEQRHYVRTPEGVVGIGTWRSNAANDARYWHKDHLGSVAVITDAAGTVKEKFGYDAWGNRTVITSAQSTGDPYNEERGYTGHEHLVEVGLTHRLETADRGAYRIS